MQATPEHNDDKNVVTPKCAGEVHKQITNSKLAIIPGVNGEYIGVITTLKPYFKETSLFYHC